MVFYLKFEDLWIKVGEEKERNYWYCTKWQVKVIGYRNHTRCLICFFREKMHQEGSYSILVLKSEIVSCMRSVDFVCFLILRSRAREWNNFCHSSAIDFSHWLIEYRSSSHRRFLIESCLSVRFQHATYHHIRDFYRETSTKPSIMQIERLKTNMNNLLVILWK